MHKNNVLGKKKCKITYIPTPLYNNTLINNGLHDLLPTSKLHLTYTLPTPFSAL